MEAGGPGGPPPELRALRRARAVPISLASTLEEAMAGTGRSALAERIRNLVLSLERLVAEGVASGVVRGAAGEVESIEGLDEELASLIENGVRLLNRLAEQAASRPAFPPETWPRMVASGVVRGAIEELERSAPRVRETWGELLARLDAALDRMAAAADVRATQESSPGYRARALAGGAVEGFVEQVQAARGELGGLTSELAHRAGRELAGGFIEALSQSLQPQGELRRTGRNLLTDGLTALGHRVRGPAIAIGGATLALGVTALVIFVRR